MAVLTTDERALFSAAQLAQLARLSDSRATAYLTPPDGVDPVGFRVRILGRLAKMTPDQLRARVNIVGVSWGAGNGVITWAPECDYTATQMQTLADKMKPGVRWCLDAPDLLLSLSTEQRLTALEVR